MNEYGKIIKQEISIFKIIKQVMDQIKQNMDFKFKKMHLTALQSMIMGILFHHKGRIKITDFSELLGISNSNASGIIDRLEQQGCVERVRSKEDRRVVYVSVTPEFKQNSKKNFEEAEKKFDNMLYKATDEELKKIVDGLNTLKEVMER